MPDNQDPNGTTSTAALIAAANLPALAEHEQREAARRLLFDRAIPRGEAIIERRERHAPAKAKIERTEARDFDRIVTTLTREAKAAGLERCNLDALGLRGAFAEIVERCQTAEGIAHYKAKGQSVGAKRTKTHGMLCYITAPTFPAELRKHGRDLKLKFKPLPGALEGRAPLEALVQLARDFPVSILVEGREGEQLLLATNGALDNALISRLAGTDMPSEPVEETAETLTEDQAAPQRPAVRRVGGLPVTARAVEAPDREGEPGA
jgi:hypothetical protein